jgi:hypothetical protein
MSGVEALGTLAAASACPASLAKQGLKTALFIADLEVDGQCKGISQVTCPKSLTAIRIAYQRRKS